MTDPTDAPFMYIVTVVPFLTTATCDHAFRFNELDDAIAAF